MTQIIDRPPLRGDGTPEPDGPLLTELRSVTTLTMAQAINRALHDAMAGDDRVLEDVAGAGGGGAAPRRAAGRSPVRRLALQWKRRRSCLSP